MSLHEAAAIGSLSTKAVSTSVRSVSEQHKKSKNSVPPSSSVFFQRGTSRILLSDSVSDCSTSESSPRTHSYMSHTQNRVRPAVFRRPYRFPPFRWNLEGHHGTSRREKYACKKSGIRFHHATPLHERRSRGEGVTQSPPPPFLLRARKFDF